MWRMMGFCVLLLLLVLSGGSVRAQDSEITTVTGFYVDYPDGEYENALLPCQSSEVWDLATDRPAFSALSRTYTSLKNSGQVGRKYGELFVELRGRYRAYTDKVHSDGVFEITEFVRHSTAAVDPTTCALECEDIHGANSAICLAQIDGQCGSARNSCVTGDYAVHYDRDTATEYRWVCAGSYGGDNVECTAPKAGLREIETSEHVPNGGPATPPAPTQGSSS